jgi:hypothetical protein
MKREVLDDEEYPNFDNGRTCSAAVMAVFTNKDLVAHVIGPMLEDLEDRSAFAQTNKSIRSILVNHDHSIRLLSKLWSFDEMPLRQKQVNAVALGKFECVEYLVSELTDNLNFHCLEVLLHDARNFAKVDVYQYLFNLFSAAKTPEEDVVDLFKRAVYLAIETGYLEFAKSLFSNHNNAWMDEDYFELLKMDFDGLWENIQVHAWELICTRRTDLDEIKQYEPVFNLNSTKTFRKLLPASVKYSPEVMNYVWHLVSIDKRKDGNFINRILLDLHWARYNSPDKIIQIFTLILKDNPDRVTEIGTFFDEHLYFFESEQIATATRKAVLSGQK